MALILFLICITASTAGAIVGFGGGVVIKPVLDAFGLLPVTTISFLSGCTVLSMSTVSLIKGKNDGIKLEVGIVTPLAIGAILGGLSGDFLLSFVVRAFPSEAYLGLIQSVILMILNIGVFIYILNKSKIKSMNVVSKVVCAIIGFTLGIISSFLGIGGGPINVAVLFMFFSMKGKEAAKNSLYVIMFSQTASLVNSIVSGTVPDFGAIELISMALGGIGGALVGAKVSKKIDEETVAKFLNVFMVIIILINIYNVINFSKLVM